MGDGPAAAESRREEVEKGYTSLDTFSPFPIHGMDAAMGLPVSKLGFLVFGGGATGAFLGVLMQWWMGGVDYQINVSNKPLFALEASVPIIFELTILFAALGGLPALRLTYLAMCYLELGWVWCSWQLRRVTQRLLLLNVLTGPRCFRGRTGGRALRH